MKIYTVLSYTHSWDCADVDVKAYKSFKSREVARRYLLNKSREDYDEFYDEDEFDYTCGELWAQISNEEHNDDPDRIWFRCYQINVTNLCEEETIILNS